MSRVVVTVGRQPPSKDFIGKFLEGLGGAIRQLGEGIDELGLMVQGSLGTREKLQPNTAWLPFKDEQVQATGYKASTTEVVSDPYEPSSSKVQIVHPSKEAGVFVAPNAQVIGSVQLGQNSSVWYGAVLRGDVNAIVVGDRTNIQDNAIIHVAKNSISGEVRPTIIGSNVTVGHAAIVHACKVGDGCLVGMGAVLLDGSEMKPGSVVAAGAVLPPRAVVAEGEVWAGSPAKFLRKLTEDEAKFIQSSALNYMALADEHSVENAKQFEDLLIDNLIEEERNLREGSDIDIHMGLYRDPETQAVVNRAH